jgi:hypothetical protein
VDNGDNVDNVDWHVTGLALAPPSGERCAEVLVAIAALGRADRIWLTTHLAREALAPIPPGIENVHPDTLCGALRAESSETIHLIATDAPPVVRKASADALRARDGEEPAARQSSTVSPEVVADLQRAVLGAIVAVPARSADLRSKRWAYRLVTLPAEEILAEVIGTGADLLGTSLRGADDATLRRAAVHFAAPWSRRVLDQATTNGDPDNELDAPTRSQARALVAATPPADDPLRTLARLGARVLGDRLNRQDPGLTMAVAQRLPAEVGRELLRAANAAEVAVPGR